MKPVSTSPGAEAAPVVDYTTTAKGAAEDLLGAFTLSGRRGARPVEDRHVAIS
jgi:hypothetical protein